MCPICRVVFEWKPEYCVGTHSIDGQHQNLFAAARELHEAIGGPHSRLTVGRLLDRLIRYTQIHFRHEERLLEQSSYPELLRHRLEHEKLTTAVLALQQKYEAGGITTCEVGEVSTLLTNWLSHHIMEMDHHYVPYLKAAAEGSQYR